MSLPVSKMYIVSSFNSSPSKLSELLDALQKRKATGVDFSLDEYKQVEEAFIEIQREAVEDHDTDIMSVFTTPAYKTLIEIQKACLYSEAFLAGWAYDDVDILFAWFDGTYTVESAGSKFR